MKRVLSLCLVSFVLFSTVVPVIAQKERTARGSKIKASQTLSRFGSIRALTDGSGVLISWQMAGETNNAGFYVYTIDNSGQRLVSTDMTLGSAYMYGAMRVDGTTYSLFDPDGGPSSVYYIRSISMDGKSQVSNTIATEWTSDIKTEALNRGVLTSKRSGRQVAEKLRLPKAIQGEVRANRIADDPVTHKWVISQPGVKIGVRREGLYRVTNAELQAGGFNINGDSSRWQLYTAGVQQSITVGAGYIEFYGKGIDTPESDTRMYYLITGPTAGKRIQTRPARAAVGTVVSPNYNQTSVQKERVNYSNQVLNGDLENYWGQSITTFANTTFNFNLSGVDFGSANSTLDLKFQGFSGDAHVVQVTLNGHALASATGLSRIPFSKQYSIPTAYLNEGANSLVFHAAGVVSDFSFFDSISVGFARKQVASENRINFYTQNFRISKLEGFASANIRVFDMSSETSPVMLSNLTVAANGATFGITLPADRGTVMFAVEDSGLLQAASVSPNDPALLSDPSLGANLVIISYKDWLPEAENWANYRRGQGFSVKVVDVAEIYDEFNFGALSSLSIKAFLQYAENNWDIAPGYVLLLGDASFDSRNYEGYGYNNLVPTHIVNTVFTETGSDDFLADFNNDGLAEMAVGRIPARDAQTVTNALAKVTAFEQAAPTLAARGVLFASDSFDAANNYDFQLISSHLRDELPPGTPATMIARSDTPPAPDTPRTLLLAAVNSGKLLVNYSGHGSLGTWHNSGFFSSFDVPLLTNASNQSVFTMLTCLNGYFLHSNFVSLAENLLNAQNGGAVAAWASTGETTPDVQEIMATRFYSKMGNSGMERLGDLINDAKSAIPGGVDVRLSWALLGDPMLKVKVAQSGD